MKKLFGVYKTYEEAQKAVDDLKSLGYRADEISVFSKHREDVDRIEGAETIEAENLKSGAATGAAAGAAIGTVGAALAAAGALFIPGIGPILAAGPIATLLTGAVAGGAVGGAVGTLAGALANLGVDDDDARYIDERFNEGDVIVHVDSDDEGDKFDRTNALLGATLRRDLRTDDVVSSPDYRTSNIDAVETERIIDRDYQKIPVTNQVHDIQDRYNDAKLAAERGEAEANIRDENLNR